MKHQAIRVRHELKRRRLTVTAIEPLSPRMRRIAFTCPDLADFASASADDHVKLFFPTGEILPEGVRPPMRDYTPRRFDTAAGTIEIDFVIHDAGPATAWATAARVGDLLEIGGPRGSMVMPDDFDWYLLIGDETALPAIGRRLEELRADVPVTTFVLVDAPEDAVAIDTVTRWTPNWVPRVAGQGDDATLLAALEGHQLPSGGEGFIWIAAESEVARAARRLFVETRGHPKEWLKAAGYWKRGAGDTHERIED